MPAALAPPDQLQSRGNRLQLFLSSADGRRLRLAAAAEAAEHGRLQQPLPVRVQLPDFAVLVGAVRTAPHQQQLHSAAAPAEEDGVVADGAAPLLRRHQPGDGAEAESREERGVAVLPGCSVLASARKPPTSAGEYPREPPAGAAERAPEAAESGPARQPVHKTFVADGYSHDHGFRGESAGDSAGAVGRRRRRGEHAGELASE